jgi:hypothetical protein
LGYQRDFEIDDVHDSSAIANVMTNKAVHTNNVDMPDETNETTKQDVVDMDDDKFELFSGGKTTTKEDIVNMNDEVFKIYQRKRNVMLDLKHTNLINECERRANDSDFHKGWY